MALLLKYWNEFVGIVLIVVGLVWVAKKNIQIGTEGREALFYIKGRLASLFGFSLVIVGILFLMDIIKID